MKLAENGGWTGTGGAVLNLNEPAELLANQMRGFTDGIIWKALLACDSIFTFTLDQKENMTTLDQNENMTSVKHEAGKLE